MQVIFYLNHYDTVMAALKVVLFDNSSSPNLLLRSKSLECMCTLFNNFRQDKLKEDEVFVVSISSNSYLNFKLVSCFNLTGVMLTCQLPVYSWKKYTLLRYTQHTPCFFKVF